MWVLGAVPRRSGVGGETRGYILTYGESNRLLVSIPLLRCDVASVRSTLLRIPSEWGEILAGAIPWYDSRDKQTDRFHSLDPGTTFLNWNPVEVIGPYSWEQKREYTSRNFVPANQLVQHSSLGEYFRRS